MDITTALRPPAMEEILRYDGIILDERIDNLSGQSIASEIMEADWTRPTVLVTGIDPSSPDIKRAYDHVDWVAWKDDSQHFTQVCKAFLRNIRRQKYIRSRK